MAGILYNKKKGRQLANPKNIMKTRANIHILNEILTFSIILL